jgi:hypothetical protein
MVILRSGKIRSNEGLHMRFSPSTAPISNIDAGSGVLGLATIWEFGASHMGVRRCHGCCFWKQSRHKGRSNLRLKK